MRYLNIILLMLFCTTCFSQTKKAIGSWLYRNKTVSISFLIKEDGTIEKREGKANQYLWSKTPLKGNFVFKSENKLQVKWSNKITENINLDFIDDTTAEFNFVSNKNKTIKIFKKLEEEVILDN